MELSLRQHQQWVIADIKGRIDAFNYEYIKRKLQILRKMGKTHIAIDLKEISFLSLPTLILFEKTALELKQINGQLAFISPLPEIEKHIGVFNKENLFRFTRHEDELIHPQQR